MQLFFVAILGLLFGSFLNVVIHRIPLNLSIIYPRSQCNFCGKKIRWFDLVPVLSWIILRGKCRNCRSFISLRYPLIELLTSFLFLIGFIKFSIPFYFVNLISSFIFICFLICISFIDIDHLIIPNKILLPFWISGLLIHSFSFDNGLFNYLIIDTLIKISFGTLFVYLILLSIILVGRIFYKKPFLGMGDIKLFAVLFAWIGYSGIECVIILSILIAGLFSLVGLMTSYLKRGEYIPFGPFICISSLLVWFQGSEYFLQNFPNLFWWRFVL